MPHPRRMVAFFAVAALALLATLTPRSASAASCAGMSHELTLADGAASPGSGVAGSFFTFSVTYGDNAGCAPGSIEVVIEGLGPVPMSYVSGDITNGATFRAKVALPAGRLSYYFTASSGSGAGLRTVKLKNVDPPEVVVSAAAKPTQPPAPTSTAKPAATPPARPGTTPAPVASQAPRPTRSPAPGTSTALPSAPPAAAPLLARPIRDDDDSASGGGTRVVLPTVVAAARDAAPLPWLALLASSVGAFMGLLVFAALGATYADPAPGRPLPLLRGRLGALAPTRPRQSE